MTTLTEAEAFATTVIVNAFALTDLDPLLRTVDHTLETWIATDEATATENVIVAYSIIGDVLAHVSSRIEARDER